MPRLLITAALAGVLVLAAPLTLLAVALLAIPMTLASKTTAATAVRGVPGSLTATTADGVSITLDKTQLARAATIITVAGHTPGVGERGATVALMAALTESSLRVLANTSAYPQSAGYPHDGDGDDHDSLGLFQMRPSTGWGTVAQLMNTTYQARAFFGGDTGPNHGSPRGLLEIPGWRSLTQGEAAQGVEVSAYPDRYANYQPVAEAIYRTLTT